MGNEIIIILCNIKPDNTLCNYRESTHMCMTEDLLFCCGFFLGGGKERGGCSVLCTCNLVSK